MNKVILMGRLTRDPEVRYTQTSNTLVASFSHAVNRRRDGAAADMDSSFGADASMPAGNGSEFEVSSGDDLPF